MRRWRHFGRSGGKLIWGGEAVAVTAEGRANPNQLLIAPHTEKGLAALRAALIEEHRLTTGSDDGLLIGLHSHPPGRFCGPRRYDRGVPNVAQAAVRLGWTDAVGLGRMVLTYPELLWDATEGRPLDRRRICRSFSDCTTVPRNGLPSGCYPLDSYYKESESAALLKKVKKG